MREFGRLTLRFPNIPNDYWKFGRLTERKGVLLIFCCGWILFPEPLSERIRPEIVQPDANARCLKPGRMQYDYTSAHRWQRPPGVNDWQLRQRVARAPEDGHEPGADAPIITESGLLMPGTDVTDEKPTVDGDPFAGDEEEYTIDKIEIRAEGWTLYYKIWIRWGKDSTN